MAASNFVSEGAVSAQMRRIKAAHDAYREEASALLAYSRLGSDPHELIQKLNRTVAAVEVLIQACEAVPAALGLSRGQSFPDIVDILEKDVFDA